MYKRVWQAMLWAAIGSVAIIWFSAIVVHYGPRWAEPPAVLSGVILVMVDLVCAAAWGLARE